MGWLSKIFKGSTHKISERLHYANCGDDVVWNEPSCSTKGWSEHDCENIDHAIALSLEDEQERKQIINREHQLAEDEQLARAIQESLTLESPPRNGHEYMHEPIQFPYSAGFRICAGCHFEIGHGRFFNCMGAIWHPECFRCHACSLPICDYEFAMSSLYPFHKSCYKDQFHPKCDVCCHFIPTNVAGLIEYRAHPFWIQKYCPSHEHDGTARCCSCERMESHGMRYVELNDGRKLCLECLDTAVMETKDCAGLYDEIRRFYEGLDMKIEQEIPVLLVERQALNEAIDGEKNVPHHVAETRGLCLSEERTIKTISRRTKVRGGNGGSGEVKTEPYKLTRSCEVTAILILYGLPRLLTGSILAHEMMHAWLRLRGFRTLSQEVEEGICQVLARMWLNHELAGGLASSSSSRWTGGSAFDVKLGDFFRYQIESDMSPVYGEGFRAGDQAVQRYGLPRTLENIRLTGQFP